MIFSSLKWEDASEIMPYVGVSMSLEFSTMEAPLRNSFEMFIRPLIGDAMVTDLIAIYDKTSPTAKETRLLQLAQRANALLAFWYDYDEMQVLIGDAGAKRQESDSVKTPYKYQEQSLKRGWKEKGFNALDDLLAYLETEIATFESFANSTNYTNSKTAIIRNTSEVDYYYYTGGSRLIFLRLKAHFRTVIDTIIAPRLGTIYADLLTDLIATTPQDKFLKLRQALIPVVVYHSVARLITETGSLTDKGLFFETLSGGNDLVTSSPATADMMVAQSNRAEGDALSYWKIAEKLLKSDFEYTTSSGNRVPKRINLDKKAFWG